MWRSVFGVLVVAGLLAALSTETEAGDAAIKSHLKPAVDSSSVRAKLEWASFSERSAIVLRVSGAEPLSKLRLRVCGPTIEVESGNVWDGCWATFSDPWRHWLNIDIDEKGKAEIELTPKLGVGPVVLMRAARFELLDFETGELVADGEVR